MQTTRKANNAQVCNVCKSDPSQPSSGIYEVGASRIYDLHLRIRLNEVSQRTDDYGLTQCTVSPFMRVPIRHNTERPELCLLGLDFLGSSGLASFPNLARRHLGDVDFEIFQSLVLDRKTVTIPSGDIAMRS